MRTKYFSDPALGVGVYEGDLKYGRCSETTPTPHHDYHANRDGNGVATNSPIFSLPMAHKRDPKLWKKGYKGPKKAIVNPPMVSTYILRELMKPSKTGLVANISVYKIEGSIITAGR